RPSSFFSFSFHPPPPTDIYTLSLHDALPICLQQGRLPRAVSAEHGDGAAPWRRHADAEQHLAAVVGRAEIAHLEDRPGAVRHQRSEEHTSELQSPYDLVCRLLLEKKKKKKRR